MLEHRLMLNGKEVEFTSGQTVLEAAQASGIQIPTLCHYPQAHSGGVCGVCVVQDANSGELLRSCVTEAQAEMNLLTDSPAVRAARQAAIKDLLLSGDHNCLVMDLPLEYWTGQQLRIMQKPWHGALCPSYGDCRLQDLAIKYGVSLSDATPRILDLPPDDGQPLDDGQPMIVRDFSRCIQCGRCVAACNQVQVNQAIPDQGEPAGEHQLGWYPLADYDKCTHCGECVQACPVGALFERKSFGRLHGHEAELVRTTCPYCGVGCQLWLHVKDQKVVKVTGVEGAQPNQGRLCVKGRFGYDFIYSKERLTTPLIREGEGFREASWDEALDLVANKFLEIKQKHGPDAIAGVSCARSTNEDSYQMQKLFRAVIGTNNIDHCART